MGKKFEDHVKESLEELHRILSEKNHNYGVGNIAKYGLNGITIRLSDKLARLENLLMMHENPKQETLEDTFRDIAGYAVLALLLMKGQLK